MKTAITGIMLRPEDEKGLKELGFKTIKIPPSQNLEAAVSAHADLLIFILKDHLFTPRDYYLKNQKVIDEILSLSGFELSLVEAIPSSPYPSDVPLCALNLGDRSVIANKKVCAPEILEFCEKENISVHDTKQGYSRCTAAYMGGLVTADPSILKATDETDFKTLKISHGSVDLPGYKHGFIGGACGFDGQKICFCGSLEHHPDRFAIEAFCEAFGVECISLSKLPLLDIGSIFFI